ncbi:MAG: hypothetical protein LLF76_09285 [Planctomycetaceae bacterium]|nr:hypothetical protein [Planctomycetaceae bacterium]
MANSANNRSGPDHALWLVIVGLAAWAVPGAGHFLIRERKRGVILFVCITALFCTGLYIGSIGVVNRVASWPWFLAQIFFSPAVGILSKLTQNGQFPTYGRPCDIGQIYTGIAGLLNLLCILSSVYMAYCGRGELIGAEEDESA